jgi:hypothetical protein
MWRCPARPHRSHCQSPANAASLEAEIETAAPSQANVMRPARVIIKPESGLNRVEFLTADSLSVSISWQHVETCADVVPLNEALTNRSLWLTNR